MATEESEGTTFFVDKAVNSVPTTTNKAIDCTPKTKSVRTQTKILADEEKNPPLIVKIPTKRKPNTRSIEVNTILSFKPLDNVKMTTETENQMEVDDEECEDDLNSTFFEDSDDTFEPETSQSEDTQCEYEEISDKTNAHVKSPSGDSKFIVFWSCLVPLLTVCSTCHAKAFIRDVVYKGTMLIVRIACSKNHRYAWRSQPSMKGMSVGNLISAASILFSGNTFQRTKEMMDIAKIAFISHTTYDSIQKRFLFPAVHRVFTTNRQILFDVVKEQDKIDISGDGRCDSPGYSAKYGTYSIINNKTGHILDFHVSHVRLAGNSAKMELHGLKKVFERLDGNGIIVDSITTDRHKSVRKYMKTEKKEVTHQFDVWHFSKNIKKKLVKFAKQKRFENLMPWIKSVINHFWWCCSSCNGNHEELKEKWLSILYHITNRHTWEDCKLCKKCEHPVLSNDESARKRWLKLGSPEYSALEKVVTNKSLLSDLRYLTNFNHTGTLEVYHSLYNKFCPKRLHFSYSGMIARSQIAVLDFNAGIDRSQDASEENHYKQQFSKVTQSWVLKKKAPKKEKIYLDFLLAEVMHLRQSAEKYPTPKTDSAPKNIALIEKPSKAQAIKNIQTRFS